MSLQEQRQRYKQVNDDIIFNESIIEERAREIRQIEESVEDVNQIFRDLGEILSYQRPQLESIEDHVKSTVEHTERAAKELEKAYKYSRWGTALTMGLLGAAAGGPLGVLAGVKSGIALAGISVGTGYTSYKVAGWLY